MTRRASFVPLLAVLSMTALPPNGAAAEGRTIAYADGEPATVSALRANGARVVELGERGGLAGYLVEPASGDPYSLYVTLGGYAVAGLLYGPDGGLITGDQIAAARGTADRTEGFDRPASRNAGSDAPLHMAHATEGAQAGPGAEALFERSAAAFGFTLGGSGPLVVLFGDPSCRWSRSAAATLGREALAGRFRLHVVPVGLLGAASAREAAAIASAPDPAAAWFDRTAREAAPEGGLRIARNNDLFDAWGETAVPLILWRGARGRIERRLGDVDDVEAWLGRLSR